MDILKDFVKATEHISMIGSMVLQDGKEIGRYMWETEYRMNQYSVSKSFTATAVGMAIEEGILKLDEPVKTYIGQYWPKEGEATALTLERLERLTLRHLITMTIGHEKASLMSAGRLYLSTSNWVTFALSIPMVYEPGKVFVYNNAGPYLAAIALWEATGMSLVDYLMPRLFEPLEIVRPTWETDPQGRSIGASGLMLSLGEIARFGQLYLQNGVWKGQQIISEEWIQEATVNQINDSARQYGLGFWIGPKNTYRADGKYGQYSLVIPEKNAVVAVNAFNRTDDSLLDIIFETVYPKL